MKGKLELGLLWEPEKLQNSNGYFSILSISTNGKLTTYRKAEINKLNLKNLRAGFSATYNEFLESIGKEVNQMKIRSAEKVLKQAGNDPGLQRMVADEIRKHTYEQVERFTRAHHLMLCYEWRVNPATGNKNLHPCTFADKKLSVHFELNRQSDHYYAVPYVSINGRSVELASLMRFEFMIQSGEQWQFLTLKDYKTIKWLEEMQAVTSNLTAEKFLEKILHRLELDYTVKKNGFFDIQEIRETPKCSIQLSELNDAFLVLLPRWNYEDLLVDGTYAATQELVHKGVRYRIYRDQAAEAAFLDYVKGLHAGFATQVKRGFFYLSFADARKRQWFVKCYRNLLEENVQITGLDKLTNFKYSPYEPTTTIQLITSEGPRVVVELKVFFGKEQVSATTVQKMLLSGQYNTLLKDDSIAVFPEEWQQEYGLYVKHAQIEKDQLQLPSWLFWEVQNKNEAAKKIAAHILPDEWRTNWRKWQENKEIVYAVPDMIRATLRPYQQKGFEWMVLLSQRQAGACLADDMGLGKTLQTICFLAWQWQKVPEGKSVVICPASLLHNWQQEMEKYLPGKSVYVYSGPSRSWDKFVEEDYDLLIVSYGTVRQDIDLISTKVWQVAVIDESHNIKNTSASITKSVGLLNAIHKVALSGTPVMNNTFDLYAQLNFVVPGLLGTRGFFNSEYVIPIDREASLTKMESLRTITAPFILRRTKRQVAKELPQRTESTLWCEMGEAQRSFYDEARTQIKESVFLDIRNKGLSKARFNVIQGLQRLRQICNAPQLLKDMEQEQSVCEDSIKIDYLIERLRDIREEGAKALVFSQFTGMLNLIAESLQKEKIDFYHFDGSTPVDTRHELVNKFQSEGDTKTAFLISLKAGNTGLNLTAAQYVFLVDPWWNNAVEQQAIDRTHRIGQQAQVFAYRMICKDTIEEKILAIQQKKKILSEELISAEEGFVKQMTEDELQYLLS